MAGETVTIPPQPVEPQKQPQGLNLGTVPITPELQPAIPPLQAHRHGDTMDRNGTIFTWNEKLGPNGGWESPLADDHSDSAFYSRRTSYNVLRNPLGSGGTQAAPPETTGEKAKKPDEILGARGTLADGEDPKAGV